MVRWVHTRYSDENHVLACAIGPVWFLHAQVLFSSRAHERQTLKHAFNPIAQKQDHLLPFQCLLGGEIASANDPEPLFKMCVEKEINAPDLSTLASRDDLHQKPIQCTTMQRVNAGFEALFDDVFLLVGPNV